MLKKKGQREENDEQDESEDAAGSAICTLQLFSLG